MNPFAQLHKRLAALNPRPANPLAFATPAERLARASAKRFAKTSLGRLQRLQAERSRWQRRQTIATNKLARVQRQIDALGEQLARAAQEHEWVNQ